jgi:hypothetical protein
LAKLFEDGAYFDRDLALDLCRCYYESNNGHTEDILTELLLQSGNLVNLVLWSEIGPSIGKCNFDFLKAEAIGHLFFIYQSKQVPVDNEKSFMCYLWTSVKHAMILAIKHKLRSQEFEYWRVCEEPAQGRLEDFDNAETRLYWSQVRSLVYDVFKSDIRFNGKEKEACVFMASCILGITNMDPMAARFRFRLHKQRTKFLLAYTRYLLRSAALLVKRVDNELVLENSRA